MALRATIRGARLRAVPDLARALSRVASSRRGGPRDLAADPRRRRRCGGTGRKILRAGATAARYRASGSRRCAGPMPALAGRAERGAGRGIAGVAPRRRLPVRAGCEAALDESARAARQIRAASSPRCKCATPSTTGIRSLKIQAQQRAGLFRRRHRASTATKLPEPRRSNATFIHRQTLAGQVRFTTTELGELEAKIANAADRALALELEIFDRLAAAVGQGEQCRSSRRPNATGAHRRRVGAGRRSPPSATTCGPKSTAASRSPITAGRHPVVEAGAGKSRRAVRRQRLRPVVSAPTPPSPARGGANSEGAGRIWLVTGPNMAGKSTFLRQNALIVVLAQAGLPVSAEAATKSAWSIGCSRAWAPPMTWRADAPPSWWK